MFRWRTDISNVCLFNVFILYIRIFDFIKELFNIVFVWNFFLSNYKVFLYHVWLFLKYVKIFGLLCPSRLWLNKKDVPRVIIFKTNVVREMKLFFCVSYSWIFLNDFGQCTYPAFLEIEFKKTSFVDNAFSFLLWRSPSNYASIVNGLFGISML